MKTSDNGNRGDAPQYLCSRLGVTFIEITVGMAVLSLLIAISLPAVLNSRAASQRISCASNTRQIIQAIQNLESRTSRLCEATFHRHILGDLGASEDTVTLSGYACPSDPEAVGNIGEWRISYFANLGLKRHSANGFLHPSMKNKLAAITDGTSHTAAVAERLSWPSIAGQIVNWDDYPQYWKRRLRDTAVYRPTIASFADECENHPLQPLTTWVGFSGYTHILPPNRPSCINENLGRQPRAITLSSLHRGGVNLALVDGSVRFISDSIDRDVWWALGTRDGNEVLSDP